MYLFLHPGDEDSDDVVFDFGQHVLVVVVKLVVLCGYHDGVDALCRAVVVVFYGHLTLGVGAQVGHFLAFASDVGQGPYNQVSQIERYRHVIFCLVAGVAEHHALVAGTLLVVVAVVHAAVDVLALLMDGIEDAA